MKQFNYEISSFKNEIEILRPKLEKLTLSKRVIDKAFENISFEPYYVYY